MSEDHQEGLPKAYEPAEVEARWYRRWEAAGCFRAEARSSKPPYCIVLPPPNVTGSLHIGHALTATLEDILVRWHRMRGFNTLWQPGVDHAGIATQMVVERELKRAEKKSRHDLGRAEFVRRIWEWKERYGARIQEQHEHLGASLDWSRSRFTMDAGSSRAVLEVFVRLHEEGFLYRANRLINWCPDCRTALRDLEVEHEERQGSIWEIRYPVKGQERFLTVATTRPETMLGDTAVAVHPEDARYRDLVGKTVILPLLEPGDPGHRRRDARRPGVRHRGGEGHSRARLQRLPDRAAARPADDLHPRRGGSHQRGRRAVRGAGPVRGPDAGARGSRGARAPRVREAPRTQHRPVPAERHHRRAPPLTAVVREDRAAGQAGDRGGGAGAHEDRPRDLDRHLLPLDAQHPGLVREPAAVVGTSNPRLVLRGLHAPDVLRRARSGEGHAHRGAHAARALPRCQGSALVQDPDVLDTWFSSGLWPFSTLGWPDRTPELETFYPTSVLETGHDILFFWVARMMMLGIHFMGDVPFRTVYLHAMVRDEKGEKMSKVKGNVVDPLDVIHGQKAAELPPSLRNKFPQGMPAFGADALRYTLAALAAQGRDIKLSLRSGQRVQGVQQQAVERLALPAAVPRGLPPREPPAARATADGG